MKLFLSETLVDDLQNIRQLPIAKVLIMSKYSESFNWACALTMFLRLVSCHMERSDQE